MTAPAYDTYRDSGIDWLGKMPSHWGVSPLKAPYAIFGGATPKSEREDYWDGGVPWVTPADLSRLTSPFIGETLRTISETGLASCAASLVPADSVILSTRAPIGSIGITTASATTNQGCKALVSRGGAVSSFLAYTLSIATEQLRVRGKGTTFLELSGDELGRFKVPTPPSAEQAAIAAFLDRETGKIDALVEAQTRLIELLKEKRQAVISHAVTKGLDPAAPMKDSGVEWLGQVPTHWDMRSIASCSSRITNGYVGPTRDILFSDGVRYLQSLHIKDGKIRFDPPYYVDPQWSQDRGKSVLQLEDVLIVQTGAVGQTAVVTEEFVGCNCHALIIVRPLLEIVRGEWMELVLRSVFGQQSLASVQTGALHPHLNCGTVKLLRVPVPSVTEQQNIIAQINAALRPLDKLLQEARATIPLLVERRAALISAAVTGKIDVRGLATEQAEAA